METDNSNLSSSVEASPVQVKLTEEQKKTITGILKKVGKTLIKFIVKKFSSKVETWAIVSILMFGLSGCRNNICIYQQRNWEGHFYNVEEFQNATKNMCLEKGESVWVLSNVTLEQAILNASK